MNKDDKTVFAVSLLYIAVALLAGRIAYYFLSGLIEPLIARYFVAALVAFVAYFILSFLAYYHPNVSGCGCGLIASLLNESWLFGIKRPNPTIATISSFVGIGLLIIGWIWPICGIIILVVNIFVIAPFASVVQLRYD